MKQLFLILILSISGFAGITIPPVIPNTKVQDHAGVFTPEQRNVIQTQLQSFVDKYETEVGVAVIQSLDGADVFEYSLKMAREYGIGSKDNEKRGILIFIAIKERKYFIQVSRHMEAYLTDGGAGSLSRQVFPPHFRKGNYSDGVLAFLSELDKKFQPKVEPQIIEPQAPTDLTGLWAVLGFLGVGGAMSGIIFYRKNQRDKKIHEDMKKERLELDKKRHLERVKEEEKHRKWLLTPEGIRWKKREDERIKQEKIRRDREIRKQREWEASPEGKAELARRKRKREEEEAEERRRRQRDEDSYSSSYSSGSSSSYSSSSSSSSSSGFGGGSDFGGGGGGGDW